MRGSIVAATAGGRAYWLPPSLRYPGLVWALIWIIVCILVVLLLALLVRHFGGASLWVKIGRFYLEIGSTTGRIIDPSIAGTTTASSAIVVRLGRMGLGPRIEGA